jgi:hypothetical protein
MGSSEPTGVERRSDALDCVVCGQEIALDDEVVVVWSDVEPRTGHADVPTAVSLARCRDQVEAPGDRMTGPYSLREALVDILKTARHRGRGALR